MLLGESGWRHAIAAAVWPDLVVVMAPRSNRGSGLLLGLNPLLVQALIPDLAVEAFDIAVLHWSPWLNQIVPDAVRVGRGHEDPAVELRAVVWPGSYSSDFRTTY